jgi:hypothetical protein
VNAHIYDVAWKIGTEENTYRIAFDASPQMGDGVRIVIGDIRHPMTFLVPRDKFFELVRLFVEMEGIQP